MNQFPKRNRLTTSPLSSPRATPRPCFFTRSENTKKWAAISPDVPRYLHRSFWSSRCADEPRPNVFLNIDDDIGLAQILGELLDIAAQLLILFGDGIARGLGPAPPRRQRLKRPRFLLFAPGRHERRIQTVAAKQRADTAGAFGSLDLGQNALLELKGEMATLGLRHNLGIGAGGR